MEFPDFTPARVSNLPVPSNRVGEAGARDKPEDSPTEVAGDFRFRHVHFRGVVSSENKRRKGKVVPSPRPAGFLTQPMDDAGTSFLRRILASAGLNPALYRAAPLTRRLPACLRALRSESPAAAERLFAAQPSMVPKALESLLIGTTELFRDPAVFKQLEDEILPGRIRHSAGPRIWSAGCSEGAELYSVAMLMAKLGGLGGSQLLGSDCRPEAIKRAKQGVYVPGERPLPVTGDRYWQALPDGRISMSQEMRQSVTWEQADLLAPRPLGTWDLILCRNLAIYLERAAADHLWQRLADALVPGGFLIVGKAEKPLLSCLRRVAPSIYCKCTRQQSSS